jgi:hypothetical protein
MLSYLSHLLQPLDVVPYSLLKRYYGDRISLLARSRIYYVSKETFLPAFKQLLIRRLQKKMFAQGSEALG